MRESPRNMGLMSHAALAQGIATREAFDEAFREQELPPPDADLPAAPASDVPTPSTFAEAESSEHAAIWRDSRTREFRGLLQANTFGPHSNQSVTLLTRSDCLLGNPMSLVGLVKRSRDSSRADSNSVKE